MITTQLHKTTQLQIDALLKPKYGIALTENTLLTLLSIVVDDLEVQSHFPYLQGQVPLNFFSLSLNEQDFVKCSFALRNVVDHTYGLLLQIEPDAERYLNCLAKYHKTRLKYNSILSKQPLPEAKAVVGKGLLHYGLNANSTILNFLRWSKFFYNIDNRAAQEIGYLFEPIIAGAIGGRPFSAKTSPVRRREDISKGRQIDCLKQNEVFEIKTRVTNAASGQGRWKEELSFVDDCVSAGLTPVLLVLFDTDGEPKNKLNELRAKFEAHGRAYVGEEAWVYMEKVAGKAMAIFLTKYVKRPLLELLKESDVNTSLTISMDNDGGIEVSDDNHHMDLINRYVKNSER